ncbi:MAG: DUF393 domain-containing protein [Pseudomonadota bacterium]
MTENATLTVYFDGACPLCRSEIGFYQRQSGAEAIDWVDISGPGDGEVAPGLSRGAARGRFHVRDAEGELISGGVAFAELWRALPRFAWAGRLFARAPFRWLINAAYEVFLPLRPYLQRFARKVSSSRGVNQGS